MKAKTKKRYESFTAEEKAAMQARVAELKVGEVDGDGQIMAKLASMGKPDRVMGERVHAIVKGAAPSLTSRLYYGMPAYAKDGKVLFWFKAAEKFKTRYATLGFSDAAHLDDGEIWATEYALPKLTPAVEAKIGALVKKAAR
jgi:uncharacterized protein YdhG (YjbR/CyaY superfamily)